MASPSLLEKTRDLVKRREGLTLRQIAEGAKVDFEWLSKFARGEINDPGVRKVQAVHDFMVEQQRAA